MFSLRGWEVAIDNSDTLHRACHGRNLACGKGFQGRVEVQRTKHLQNSNIFSINKVTTIYFMPFLLYTRLKNPIGILTKINKINIVASIQQSPWDSTLTHVRYYLDDPVHLLVSCADYKKCDCNFVHQVFGAVAGDCSSLNN